MGKELPDGPSIVSSPQEGSSRRELPVLRTIDEGNDDFEAVLRKAEITELRLELTGDARIELVFQEGRKEILIRLKPAPQEETTADSKRSLEDGVLLNAHLLETHAELSRVIISPTPSNGVYDVIVVNSGKKRSLSGK